MPLPEGLKGKTLVPHLRLARVGLTDIEQFSARVPPKCSYFEFGDLQTIFRKTFLGLIDLGNLVESKSRIMGLQGH